MYDKGNYIQVPSQSTNYVVYKDNCDEGMVNRQQYFMDINNSGFSVTLFSPYKQGAISIKGDVGADGKPGSKLNRGSYKIYGWNGFWKTITEQDQQKGHTYDDPGVNHLWITNAHSASHRIPNLSTGNDTDILENVKGYTVIYLLWATQEFYVSSDTVMRQLITSVATSISGEYNLKY